MDERMAEICFGIIAGVGSAKSCYIQALQEAKKGNFDKAEELIKEGEENFINGHGPHAELIAQEASGDSVEVCMLLMHAEDQLMATETTKLLVLELIDLYKKMK